MPFADIDINNIYDSANSTQKLQNLKRLDSENSFGKALNNALDSEKPTSEKTAQKSQTTLQKLTAAEDKKLRKQTDQFEAIFLQMVLKDAIKNENPLYPKQAGSDIYHSMYIEQMAQNLSGGFGYSELLYNYLKGIYA